MHRTTAWVLLAIVMMLAVSTIAVTAANAKPMPTPHIKE